jgi:psp operon transcriptional activator
MESELFGHERGAFTDAKSNKRGTVELADGGTVVLDEVAELKLELQSKLLSFLEDRSFRRVGGVREISVDIRIIALTNRNLGEMVADGRFRNDLYYRLSVFPITVPPLRERVDDILPLANAFAINMASELKWSYFAGFSPRASSALLRNRWPGNVRELKNTIERSVYRSPDPEQPIAELALDPFDSPFKLAAVATGKPKSTQQRRAPLLPTDLRQRLVDVESDLLEAALEKARYNQRLAAELLNLSYHQLRGRLKKLGIAGKPSSPA